MNTMDAIFTRRSVGEVKPDPVPVEIINKLLSAAVQAPNHHNLRPWRFIVLTGVGLLRLGDVLAISFSGKFPQAPIAAVEKERSIPLRAPLIIAVGVDEPVPPRGNEVENICAVAAAVQNLLLAAQSLGLAVKWRTGETARNPQVKQFLGLAPAQHLVALLYIGFPLEPAPIVARPGFEDRTVWLD